MVPMKGSKLAEAEIRFAPTRRFLRANAASGEITVSCCFLRRDQRDQFGCSRPVLCSFSSEKNNTPDTRKQTKPQDDQSA